ncbi:MAG: dihydrolipoyl dehydrogenase [Ignavibacteria bacterium]|nr:dihydrolipoyl dehydrogenase [Ignavibacteria bacterium]
MQKFDITVIGAGPGGYTAAIRAAQLGFKTAIIERDKLGGVCLNWGCIPTKALLRSADIMNLLLHLDKFGFGNYDNITYDFPKIIKRSRDVANASEKGVNYLMKKNKIDVFYGNAKLNRDKEIIITDKDGKQREIINSEHIIIATGARPRTLGNVQFDESKILSSTGAMLMQKPPKKLTVVGSGAIGMEFAYFYRAFGSDVTIIEMLPQLLPLEDEEISIAVAKEFKKYGISFYTNTKTESIQIKDDVVLTTTSGQYNGTFEADAVLLAIGVIGNIENLGLEELNIKTFKNGIVVNKDYKTNIDGIYAIGDVAVFEEFAKPMLAHVASAEGINCIEKIKGLHNFDINYNNIPACTYCQPQVASIGLTESKAKQAGYEIKVGKFPFSANGKARAIGELAGFVKLIFDAKYGELLGAHIVGPEATELISEVMAFKSMEAVSDSIIKAVHAHPTLAEAILEAAGVAYNEAINI